MERYCNIRNRKWFISELIFGGFFYTGTFYNGCSNFLHTYNLVMYISNVMYYKNAYISRLALVRRGNNLVGISQYDRNFDWKSCFVVFFHKWNEWKSPQFNFSCQDLSIECNFFKWDGKVTRYHTCFSIEFGKKLLLHWISFLYLAEGFLFWYLDSIFIS